MNCGRSCGYVGAIFANGSTLDAESDVVETSQVRMEVYKGSLDPRSNNGPCDAQTDKCNQVGYDLRIAAQNLGNASTGLLIAGGLLFATGVTLVVLRQRKRSAKKAARTRGFGSARDDSGFKGIGECARSMFTACINLDY